MNGDAEFTEIIVGETVEQHLSDAHVADLGRHVAPDCETFVSATLTGYLLDDDAVDEEVA